MLLKNTGSILPLKANQIHSMAVIGNAAQGTLLRDIAAPMSSQHTMRASSPASSRSLPRAPRSILSLRFDGQTSPWEFDSNGTIQFGLQGQYFDSSGYGTANVYGRSFEATAIGPSASQMQTVSTVHERWRGGSGSTAVAGRWDSRPENNVQPIHRRR